MELDGEAVGELARLAMYEHGVSCGRVARADREVEVYDRSCNLCRAIERVVLEIRRAESSDG